MLISKTAIVKWNAKTKNHYVDLGYKFTMMGDEFEVKVDDLTSGSNVMIDVECDYCHKIYQTKWYIYYNGKNKLIKKDCCNNPECTGKKALETLQHKYDVANIREIPHVNEAIASTNMKKYGVKNPFESKFIQNKIVETNRSKYGVDWYTQTDEYKERYKKHVWRNMECQTILILMNLSDL